jgi:cytochrome c oxidase accessory protein FixG
MSSEQKKEYTLPEIEDFRDSIPTVDADGNRVWMYPKKPPTGKQCSKKAVNLYSARTWFSLFLLVVLFAGPFIRINGNPLLMFNIVERKFSIFGQMFWPQDLNIFALMMVLGFLMITLFTAVFGRLWCGWACPQTVLMEMVFRKIEYFIEGDSTKQQRLNKSEWDSTKIFKKATKWFVFFALSFVISNWLLMYVIGSDAWWAMVNEPASQHATGLTAMIIFTFVFFGIFARFREQACTFVCPYGRFQSVMIDENTLVVGYDHVRGEGRGKRARGESTEARTAAGKGDCVDCNLCVAVCPTGIDIRNGIQMECVNCTACIDACNSIMDRLALPPGLIGYNSLNGIKEKKRFKLTPRLMAYCGLLFVLGGLLVFLLSRHQNIEVNMLRTPGTLYTELPGNLVANTFNVKLLNKTSDTVSVKIELDHPDGLITVAGETITAEAQTTRNSIVIIKFPSDKLSSPKFPIKLHVTEGDKTVDTIDTLFIGPRPKLKKRTPHEN